MLGPSGPSSQESQPSPELLLRQGTGDYCIGLRHLHAPVPVCCNYYNKTTDSLKRFLLTFPCGSIILISAESFQLQFPFPAAFFTNKFNLKLFQ